MFIDPKRARVLAAYKFTALVAPFFALVLCLGLPCMPLSLRLTRPWRCSSMARKGATPIKRAIDTGILWRFSPSSA